MLFSRCSRSYATFLRILIIPGTHLLLFFVCMYVYPSTVWMNVLVVIMRNLACFAQCVSHKNKRSECIMCEYVYMCVFVFVISIYWSCVPQHRRSQSTRMIHRISECVKHIRHIFISKMYGNAVLLCTYNAVVFFAGTHTHIKNTVCCLCEILRFFGCIQTKRSLISLH